MNHFLRVSTLLGALTLFGVGDATSDAPAAPLGSAAQLGGLGVLGMMALKVIRSYERQAAAERKAIKQLARAIHALRLHCSQVQHATPIPPTPPTPPPVSGPLPGPG